MEGGRREGRKKGRGYKERYNNFISGAKNFLSYFSHSDCKKYEQRGTVTL